MYVSASQNVEHAMPNVLWLIVQYDWKPSMPGKLRCEVYICCSMVLSPEIRYVNEISLFSSNTRKILELKGLNEFHFNKIHSRR